VTPQTVLLVSLGAALGAPLRFVVERRMQSAYPWGTWVVNVVGSAVLGALAGHVSVLADPGSAAVAVALVGTGFCGALTTFGGFAAQVLDLAAAPGGGGLGSRSWRAFGYGSVSVVACVAVAALAFVTAAAASG
jgi:CrcB protein